VVVLPEPLAAEVRRLLAGGERIEAVKLTRRRTGLNLLPAVRAVDALNPGERGRLIDAAPGGR